MREAARRAARSRLAGLGVRKRCRVPPPLPIGDRRGAPAGWFVGVAVGDRLLGFLQFDANEALMRTSWFPMRGSLADLPSAAAWLDAAAIRALALRAALPNEKVGEPYLSFDRHPTRLLWRVPVERDGHRTGEIEVIGDSSTRRSPPSGN